MEPAGLVKDTALRLVAIIGACDDVEYVKHIVMTVTSGIRQWAEENNYSQVIDEFFAVADLQCDAPNKASLTPFYESYYCTPEVEMTLMVNPTVYIVKSEIARLISVPASNRFVVFGGHAVDMNSGWWLQDGVYSINDFQLGLNDPKLLKIVPKSDQKVPLTISCIKAQLWKGEKDISADFPLDLVFSDPVKSNMSDAHSQDLNGGSADPAVAQGKGLQSFGDYLEDFMSDQVGNIFTQLRPPPHSGQLKIRSPSVYIFPAGNGDSMFFAVNGFNVLVNGGSLASPWFWRLTSHLETLDCMIATHLSTDCLTGLNSFLLRKLQEKQIRLPMDNTSAEYKELEACLDSPNLGSFYMNVPEKFAESALRKQSSDPDKHDLANPEQNAAQHLTIKTVNVVQDTLRLSKRLGLSVLPLTRGQAPDPITVYSKLWLGKLDIYVLSPDEGSPELKYIREKWGSNGKICGTGKTGVTVGSEGESEALLSDLASICCLFVWYPTSPNEKIVRILFPGNASQEQVIQGLEKMKNCSFLSMPSPTPALLNKPKAATSPAKPPRSNTTAPKSGIHAKAASHSATSKPSGHATSKTSAHSKPTTASAANGTALKAAKTVATGLKKAPVAKKPAATAEPVRTKREAATGFVKPAGKRTKPEKTNETASSSVSATKQKSAAAKPKTGPVHAKAEARVHAKQASSKVSATKSTSDVKPKAATKTAAKPAKPTASKQSTTKKLTAPISIKGGLSPSKDKSAKEKKKEEVKKDEVKVEKPPLTPPEDLTDAFASLKEEKKVEGDVVGKDLPKRPSPEGQDGRDPGQFVDVAHVSAEIAVVKPEEAQEHQKLEPEADLPEEKADNIAEYLDVHDSHFADKSSEKEVAEITPDNAAAEDSEVVLPAEPELDSLRKEEPPAAEHAVEDVTPLEPTGEDVAINNDIQSAIDKEDVKVNQAPEEPDHIENDFEVVGFEHEATSSPDLKQEEEKAIDLNAQGDTKTVHDEHQLQDDTNLQVVKETDGFDVLEAPPRADDVDERVVVEDELTHGNESFAMVEKEQEFGVTEDVRVSNEEEHLEDEPKDVLGFEDLTQNDKQPLPVDNLLDAKLDEKKLGEEEDATLEDYFHKADEEAIHQDVQQPDVVPPHEEKVEIKDEKDESNDGDILVESSAPSEQREHEKAPDLLEGYLAVETHQEAHHTAGADLLFDERNDEIGESPEHAIPDGQYSPDLNTKQPAILANQSLSSVECARECENQVTFDDHVPVVIPDMKKGSYEAYDEDYYPDDEEDESNGRYDEKEWHPTPYPSDPQSMITDTSPTSELGSYEAQATDAGLSDVVDNAAHLGIGSHDSKAVEDIAMSDTPISSGPSTPTEHADLVIDSSDSRAIGDFLQVEQEPVDDKSIEKEPSDVDGDLGFSLTSTSTSKPAVIESPSSAADLDSAYNIPSMGGSISTGITTETDDMKMSGLHPESHALASIPDFQSIILPDDQEQLSTPMGRLDDNGNQPQLVDETDGWEKEIQGLAGKYQDEAAPMGAWSEGRDAEDVVDSESSQGEEEAEPRVVPDSPEPEKAPSSPPSAQERWATSAPEMTLDQFDRVMGSLHASDDVRPKDASQGDADLLDANFDRAPIMSISDATFDRFLDGDEASHDRQEPETPERSPNLFDQSPRPDEDLLVDVADHGMEDLHSSTDRPEVDQACFNGNPFVSEFSANQVREGESDLNSDFMPVRKEDPMMAQDKGRPVKTTKKTGAPASGSKKGDQQPFYVDLTYVPHHCNKNFVNVTFFKRVRAKYYVVSGMDTSQDEPSGTVLDALLEGKKTWGAPSTPAPGQDGTNVTVIPTHNSPAVEAWYNKQNREMKAENIHLLSSGNKVFVHDETVDACKVDF